MGDGDVRPLLLDELDRLLAMNQREVPHVGEVTRERLSEILAWADVSLGAVVGEELVGFLLAMMPDSPYDSPNFRWFRERYRDFLYIDRVVVAEHARRGGVARRLYDAALDARPSALLAAEVNLEPPNPGSMAFHRRYGFTEVDRVECGNGHVVAMLVRSCNDRTR